MSEKETDKFVKDVDCKTFLGIVKRAMKRDITDIKDDLKNKYKKYKDASFPIIAVINSFKEKEKEKEKVTKYRNVILFGSKDHYWKKGDKYQTPFQAYVMAFDLDENQFVRLSLKGSPELKTRKLKWGVPMKVGISVNKVTSKDGTEYVNETIAEGMEELKSKSIETIFRDNYIIPEHIKKDMCKQYKTVVLFGQIGNVRLCSTPQKDSNGDMVEDEAGNVIKVQEPPYAKTGDKLEYIPCFEFMIRYPDESIRKAGRSVRVSLKPQILGRTIFQHKVWNDEFGMYLNKKYKKAAKSEDDDEREEILKDIGEELNNSFGRETTNVFVVCQLSKFTHKDNSDKTYIEANATYIMQTNFMPSSPPSKEQSAARSSGKKVKRSTEDDTNELKGLIIRNVQLADIDLSNIDEAYENLKEMGTFDNTDISENLQKRIMRKIDQQIKDGSLDAKKKVDADKKADDDEEDDKKKADKKPKDGKKEDEEDDEDEDEDDEEEEKPVKKAKKSVKDDDEDDDEDEDDGDVKKKKSGKPLKSAGKGEEDEDEEDADEDDDEDKDEKPAKKAKKGNADEDEEDDDNEDDDDEDEDEKPIVKKPVKSKGKDVPKKDEDDDEDDDTDSDDEEEDEKPVKKAKKDTKKKAVSDDDDDEDDDEDEDEKPAKKTSKDAVDKPDEKKSEKTKKIEHPAEDKPEKAESSGLDPKVKAEIDAKVEEIMKFDINDFVNDYKLGKWTLDELESSLNSMAKSYIPKYAAEFKAHYIPSILKGAKSGGAVEKPAEKSDKKPDDKASDEFEILLSKKGVKSQTAVNIALYLKDNDKSAEGVKLQDIMKGIKVSKEEKVRASISELVKAEIATEVKKDTYTLM